MGIDIDKLSPALRKQVLASMGQKRLDPIRGKDVHVPSMSDHIKAISKAFDKPKMNRTETELYGMLKARAYGRVEFEAITLTLANGARYTPDFYCVQRIHPYALMSFYEAKGGFIREASLVRLKVAARQYPEYTFVLAQKKNGLWTEKVIRP